MSLRNLFKPKKNKTTASDNMITNDNNLVVPDFLLDGMSKEQAEKAKKHNDEIRKHIESNN